MPRNSDERGAVGRFARQTSNAWHAFLHLRRTHGPVGAVASPPVGLLICFAVQEETKFFRLCALGTTFQVWLTGMGRKNAAENVRDAIARVKPGRA